MVKAILSVISILLVAGVIVFVSSYYLNSKPVPSELVIQDKVEGKFCGGIAANLPENQCPEGYACKLDSKNPDAGGVCVKVKEEFIKPCKITGCNGEICSDEDVASACVVLPEYECYKTAKCERQADGECGWTQTEELKVCLRNIK